ncbi:hypothetical protein [Carboxylicivirga marina]|uniref:Periplasmic heavy metal sensor n=1 Tax=Carboxylicivirga marina TaxID=2800988 RepID=A0ABS1HNN3_9BACT|nr:hypothetical protein [Carboxylicivirga marina]MBK3519291.1 hypothetical protein [Carboxylicivirga marina]
MKITCKICWITLGLFLLGNVVLLGVWSFDDKKSERNKRDYNKDERRLKMRDHFKKNAGIKDAQFDSMYQLWKGHSQEMDKHQSEIDSLRHLLLNETFSDNPDSTTVIRLFNKLAEKQVAVERENYYHFRNLRSIGETDEQRKAIDKMFRSKLIDSDHRKRFRGQRHKY